MGPGYELASEERAGLFCTLASPRFASDFLLSNTRASEIKARGQDSPGMPQMRWSCTCRHALRAIKKNSPETMHAAYEPVSPPNDCECLAANTFLRPNSGRSPTRRFDSTDDARSQARSWTRLIRGCFLLRKLKQQERCRNVERMECVREMVVVKKRVGV